MNTSESQEELVIISYNCTDWQGLIVKIFSLTFYMVICIMQLVI